jgi:hypothetical protein
MDNDGYAPFDIDYLINEYHRPIMEAAYTASSSGYNVSFYNSNSEPTSGIYTNIVPAEVGSVEYVYSGSGPTFNALPPCYWHGWEYTGFQLHALPHDGDYDNDGISNKDEDTNLNINLMDDDSDGDGMANVIDSTDSPMAVAYSHTLRFVIFPNPIAEVLNIEGDLPLTSIAIFDLIGKKVFEVQSPAAQIDVQMLNAGIYILKLNSEGKIHQQKIIVK